MLAFLAQYGAGLYLWRGGVANLDGCQVYENVVRYVRACLPPPLPRPFLQRPAGTLRVLAFLAQNGAGLYVYSGGVANLDGCNVFSNEAQVRADRAGRPFPDLTSSAPLERFVCSPSAQPGYGGGLYVNGDGVANLDGCNVFSNEATVRPALCPVPVLTPAPRWNVTCPFFCAVAAWRGALHPRHGDAD